MKRVRAAAMGVMAAVSLSSAIASAHTVKVCWRGESDQSTTVFAGHYHAQEETVGGIIIDNAVYQFTSSSTIPPSNLTGCQPVSCDAFLEPFRWQAVNVAWVSPEVHEVSVTCSGDGECGWPGCYPQLMDFAPACDDEDADAVCDDIDNCVSAYNDDQLDSDGDAIGDGCDACPFDPGNDLDLDGVCGDADNCGGTANPDQTDTDGDWIGDACDACSDDAWNDEDSDGVCGDVDVCPGTVLPEDVPTVSLGVNRFADVDGDGEFDTTSPKGNGPGRHYTLEDTGGCSCEQIIDALDLGQGHVKFGCSVGVMDQWVAEVGD